MKILKSKLQDAVGGRYMQFVVGLLIGGTEEDLERVALHEGRKVQGKDILHRVHISQLRSDDEIIFRKSEHDTPRRKGGFGLGQPRLTVVPGK